MMDAIVGLYSLPFKLMRAPRFRAAGLSLASLSESRPSTFTVTVIILISYFLVTGGIIYDMIIEPPSVGYEMVNGRQVPVAFMVGRINGQYITEGLTSSFMFLAGGLGFICLDKIHDTQKSTRKVYIGLGFALVLVAYFAMRLFMSIKLPYYLK